MGKPANTHDSPAQRRALQLGLTADKRPIGFFLGAGCPLAVKKPGTSAPLIPDIKGLTATVRAKFDADVEYKPVVEALDTLCGEDSNITPTVEHYLNRLRDIQAVGGTAAIRGITPAKAKAVDKAMCEHIAEAVSPSLSSAQTPYHALARWIRGIERTAAVELFTPNYDLLLEQALEETGVPYFDGFVGSRRAFLDTQAMETTALPARWVRLWKLHGSKNWHRSKSGDVWRGSGAAEDDAGLLIFPTHGKYLESRRMPFLAMRDRLKAFLARPEAVLVVCGYSFADDHFNRLMKDGLRGNSRAVVFALCFDPLDTSQAALSLAEEAPNFLLLAPDSAMIGGTRGVWAEQKDGSPSKFDLGDFAVLGGFLAEMTGQPLTTSSDAIGTDVSGSR